MTTYSLSIDTIGPRHGSRISIHNLADPVLPMDAVNKVWVETQVAAAVVAGGAPYEASNGWISGGVISAVSGTSQFDVTAVVCRFVDYTNETSPGSAPIVTHGPWSNVLSAFPAANAIGVNLKSDGTLLQLTDPLNIQTLYGPYIHIGSIIQIGGVIRSVTNSKYPVADRHNLSITDLVQRFTPLNMNGNSVTASSSFTDLSIDVSDGYVWQHMSEVINSRSEPSAKFKNATSRPLIARIWGDTTGAVRIEAQNQQLDVNNYNPDGTGGSLQAIPSCRWVNIPILFSPASNGFAMQYPTSTYSTKAYALSNVGRFKRLDSVMKAFVVIGYVTVQQGVTDLTNANFEIGEFFSYNVMHGVSSILPDAIDFRSRTVFIDYDNGDDTTGALNLPSAPFKTYNAAVAGITNASTSGQWVVRASNGLHSDNSIRLKPNTALVGDAPRVALYDISTDKVALHGDFSQPAYDGAYLSIYCGRFINATPVELDFYSFGSGVGKATSSTFDVRDTGFYGDVIYRGRTQNTPPTCCDLSFWVNTAAWQDWTLAGGTHYIFTAVMYGTGTEKLLLDSTNVSTYAEMSNIHAKNIYILGPASGQACRAVISASHVYGTITIDGSNAHLDISRSSIENATVVLINSGTIDYYDEELTEEERLAIKGAVPAASSGNPVATEQYVSSAISTKVDKTTTVNGNSLSGDIVVAANQITTGILPHAQLPVPFLSTDIPASISSNTTGYASSLFGVQTIPADSTIQAAPVLGDNSAKIASTGWIQNMRGVSSGIAALDVTGKVPIGQLPDALTSGLKYQGTWDVAVDGTEYPSAILSGEFYIVTGSGTMEDAQVYDTGDWFVYDSVSVMWDRVPANYPDLSTFTGTSTIHTVGTITSGTWQGTIIDNARGGAGILTGILKGNGGAPVTAASSITDYIAPVNASTITGEKTFSGGLYSTSALDWTASDYSVATTSFLQNPQDQLIYVSKVGNDAWDGSSLRNAVNTINKAVDLAVNNGTVLTPAYQYVVMCSDAGTNVDVVVPEFVVVITPNMRLMGNTMLSSYSKIECRRLDTPTVGNTLVRYKYGTTGAGVASLKCYRILPGAIIVDANMGTCVLDTGIFDGLPGTEPSFDVGSGSMLFVTAALLSGVLKVASGGVLDLAAVSEFGVVSVDPSSTGTILWPPFGAGNVTGILKCNGVGIISAAVLGTDYIKDNQTITLGSDLSGSGSTVINATITDASVSLAKMANLDDMRLIGNVSGVSNTPSPISLTSCNTPLTVLYRDSVANACINHMTEAYTNTSVDITLNVASPKYLDVYGTTDRKITLPNATTLPIGFLFKVMNHSTATATVYKFGGVTVVRALFYSESGEFLCDDNGSAEGGWDVTPTNQLITLVGDVTASGRTPITTTIAPIALSKLDNIAANSVVGNSFGIVAPPSTVPMTVTALGDSVCLRDQFGNGFFNINVVGCTSIATSGTNTTLGANSTTTGVIVFSGTNVQTLTLPDATTIATGWSVRLFNQGTGNVTVNSATNQTVSVLSGGLSGIFVNTSTSTVAGIWAATVTSAFPQPLFTNSMLVPATVGGGATLTMLPADIYNGPRSFSRNGGTPTGTLIWPDASLMIPYISSTAGLGYSGGAIIPSVGFHWPFIIYCSNNNLAALPGVGVTFFPISPNDLKTIGNAWFGECVISSTSTYSVIFNKSP